MHRIEGDGYVVVGGKKQFTEGSPVYPPSPATLLTADWANGVQEELANTVEGLGGTLNTAATDTTPNQLYARLVAVFGQLVSPNARANNTAFQVAPLNNDSSEASPFLSSSTAPASTKRWTVFKLAVGGGVYARLLLSSTGSFSFTTNAAWDNTAQTWSADVGGTASYRLMLGSAGLQVYSYTAATTAGFTDAAFTTSTAAVTAAAGGLAAGGAVTAAGVGSTTALPTAGGGLSSTNFSYINQIGGTNALTYPIHSFYAKAASPASNLLGLTFRTQNLSTATDWFHTRVGLSFDVNTVVGAGGSFYLGDGGAVIRCGTAGTKVAATATTPSSALSLPDGYLSLDGAANPNGTVALKNTLTPKNITKVTASIRTTNNNGTIIIDDSTNVTSVALSGGSLLITFAQAFAGSTYTVQVAPGDAVSAPFMPAPFMPAWNTKTATTVKIAAWQVTGGAFSALSFATTNLSVDVTITGAQ